MADLTRLSFNQITCERLSLVEAIDAAKRHGIPWISPWRHKLSEISLEEAAARIRDAGLRISSLCRGGMFPAPAAEERQKRIDDNFRAIDEAATIGADVLVMVCGGLNGVNIASARAMIADGVAAIASHAKSRGVRIGLEPLHPMFAADRSVLTTIGEALKIAAPHSPDLVGVVLDVFHIWWDPELYEHIEQAGARILGFHVSDWLVPLPDVLLGRGMMGDGVLEIRRMREAVDAAGYSGPIEVEIFNRVIWDSEPDAVLAQMRERFESLV
jgi:sugar phosphate isomerase/epimerase